MKRVMPWLVGLIALALMSVGGFYVYKYLNPTDEEIISQVRLEDPPSQEDVAAMAPEPLEGDLVVESVGLSVGMDEMSEVAGVINPPGLERAYMLRDHATPDTPEAGTTFIAIHSVRGAPLPGNKLINVEAASSAVHPGDSIVVQGRSYTVTDAFTEDKTTVGSHDSVWEEKTGRLVIFTCLQRQSGHSLKNVIIEAQADDVQPVSVNPDGED